ncbi:DnaB-like helicase C-terminal domain-containing protein [Gemmatimonas sp.]|jgi:replicative DNA helicase|uniref:DnaB-like helicase C-terminal domain-containing protein n=1 Tax=Gemmatimonas sp. TaxID=1962908 RepID=UPI0037BF44C4
MTHRTDISPLTRVVSRLDRAGLGEVDPGLVPTRFPSIDRAISGGFRRGDLIVIGGDDSAGCSALSLAIALRVSPRALVLTGEMQAERAYERALAMGAKVSLESLRLGAVTEEERVRLAAAAVILRDRAPVIETMTSGTLADIDRAVEATPDASLVVVDPLECLLDRDSGRDEALGFAVLSLKRLALQRQVAVLLTTHLPQLARERQDRRPRLPDFGLGGAIGTHADLVLGLYREELYESDLGVSGAAELLLLKNRDGAKGYVDLYFDSRFSRFEDVLEE